MSNKLLDLIYTTTGIDLGSGDSPVDINAQIAVASLLAVAANSDGSIDSKETVKMVEAMCTRFSLTPTMARDLITRAIDDQPDRNDSSKLYEVLNERLSIQQKEELILMLLEVIAADGEKEFGEMTLLDQAVAALDISDSRLSKIYDRYFENRRKSGN